MRRIGLYSVVAAVLVCVFSSTLSASMSVTRVVNPDTTPLTHGDGTQGNPYQILWSGFVEVDIVADGGAPGTSTNWTITPGNNIDYNFEGSPTYGSDGKAEIAIDFWADEWVDQTSSVTISANGQPTRTIWFRTVENYQ